MLNIAHIIGVWFVRNVKMPLLEMFASEDNNDNDEENGELQLVPIPVRSNR